ncbi:hypothetical protein KXD93_01935 [Mucilaginibacter sp. BJC16-A38]|uniref:hypothetical protein n=1 Tax=Mucilaginibacter phenanthrenivorans TaxID=1234842 RepID=UPI0021573B23|nr:hypothetical protein [Mucilaginibacter phenanthrenivorans]MCR8556380.1 hypothetical protein [Mucilaginibacter phenanthrenivorans]
MFLILSGIFYTRIKKKEENIWRNIMFLCLLYAYFGYTAYQEITKFNRNVSLDKFGKAFNYRRQSLGIPIIPADWTIENRGSFSVNWKGKKDIIGHTSKHISIDSYTADYEMDWYNLKPIDSIKRSMKIRTEYAKGKGKDSIFYYFAVGDSTRTISRKQADSIFNAEKIKKDY